MTASRFTSRDPVLGQFQEPMTLHKYLYCGNNPINYTDINGKWALLLGGSGSANLRFTKLLGKGWLGRGLKSTVGAAMESSGIADGLAGLVGYYNIILPYFAHLADFMGAGATGGGGFVVAHKEDEPLTKGWSWGTMEWIAGGGSMSTSSGVAGMIDIGYSPEAQHVTDLSKWFAEYGGSVGGLRLPWIFKVFSGASFTVSKGYKRVGDKFEPTGITLYTGSLGWAKKGAEFHGFLGYAWVQEW